MKTPWLNTLRPRRKGRHFADDVFKCIFLNENIWISLMISLKFVPNVPINNIPALVQIMAWGRSGDKPLSEPIMVSILYWRIYASLGLNELKTFPHHWPFACGVGDARHQWLPITKGQWYGALIFALLVVRASCWTNIRVPWNNITQTINIRPIFESNLDISPS